MRVLFLCTRNSARSQMAEAMLAHEGGARFDVASAGSTPSMFVDPITFEVLDELGIDWRAHRPKGFETVQDTVWDLVVTVCDRAREQCPLLPGQPIFAHWSLEDPEDCAGNAVQYRQRLRRNAARLHAAVRRFVALGPAEWREYPISDCLPEVDSQGV